MLRKELQKKMQAVAMAAVVTLTIRRCTGYYLCRRTSRRINCRSLL